MTESHRAGEGRYTGMSPLHVAAFLGDAAAVQALISEGADIEAKAQYNYGTMPAVARFIMDTEERRRLALEGVNTAVRLSNGGTPLIMAASHRIPIAAAVLIEAGADVKAADEKGNTPLHYAVEAGSFALCKTLIEAGADPAAERSFFHGDGASPLHLAAEAGRADLCELLLQAGAKWTAIDMNSSPLHRAAQRGHLEACRVLVAHGADPDYRGLKKARQAHFTPLQIAMDKDCVAVVRYFLLECGANHRLHTPDGKSLSSMAQLKGRRDIMALIDELECSRKTAHAIESAIDNESRVGTRPSRSKDLSPM